MNTKEKCRTHWFPVPTRTCGVSATMLFLMLGLASCDQNGTEASNGDVTPMAEAHLIEEGVTCSIQNVSDGETVVVKMTLTNSGEETVAVSPHGTTWDQGTSVFRVESPTEQVSYKGIWAYRGEFSKEEYMEIKPGSSISKTYELSENYPVETADDYSVSMVRDVLDVIVDGQKMVLQHDCGELLLFAAPPTIRTARAPLTYDNCTSDQQVKFEDDVKQTAESMLTDVDNSIESGHPIYAEWFGSWTTTRGDTVRGVFDDILARWDVWEIECPTPCSNASWNAYYSPSKPNTIHICPPYWNLPDFSVEAGSSKAGVFVHELTHSESGTVDHVYGADNARSLAISDPDKAVDCAENYEHFSSHQYLARIITPIDSLLIL